MDNVKPYKDLSSDEKKGRRSFTTALCTNCFLIKDGDGCGSKEYDICLNAYTKGFAAGTRKHREVIKNRIARNKKKLIG